MFTPVSTPTFDQSYKKLIKGDFKKEKRTKNTVLLILLASQSIHIFWITDDIVYTTFVGSELIYMPEYLAWIAILIDYLELPVIYDLLKRIIKKGT